MCWQVKKKRGEARVLGYINREYREYLSDASTPLPALEPSINYAYVPPLTCPSETRKVIIYQGFLGKNIIRRDVVEVCDIHQGMARVQSTLRATKNRAIG